MSPVVYSLSRIKPPLTGIGRYAFELLSEVAKTHYNAVAIKEGKLYTDEDLHKLLSSLERTDKATPKSALFQQRVKALFGKLPFSRKAYQYFDQRRFFYLSQGLLESGAIHHDLNYSAVPSAVSSKSRFVCTVYDASHVVCPETHPSHRVRYLERYFRNLLDRDSHVITISHAVKSDLVNLLGFDDDQIDVTHLAADAAFHPRSVSDCDASLQSFGLVYRRYLLCVATLEPRKNLGRVLDAYEALDRATKRRYPLVLVGAAGWKSDRLKARIQDLKAQGVVIPLGYVAQSALPTLYAGAAAFVYPSLYEGFGLPLLEAMQSGTPCITSNNGALAEVANDGAILVNPEDVNELTHQLSELLTNKELRSTIGTLGLRRAQFFSWSKTASDTCAIYDVMNS